MVERLFVFGCSCTNHLWPSWADIYNDIVKPNEYYNYAIPSIGNVGILYEILSADLQFNFTPKDEVCVCWTSWTREDRYFDKKDYESHHKGWKSGGNAMYSIYYGEKFYKKYGSVSNDIVKNASAIILANKSFNISLNFHFAGIDSISTKDCKNLYQFYSPHVPNDGILELSDVWYGQDSHPNIISHLNLVSEKVKIPKSIQEKYMAHHKKILEYNEIQDYDEWNIAVNREYYSMRSSRTNYNKETLIWDKHA